MSSRSKGSMAIGSGLYTLMRVGGSGEEMRTLATFFLSLLLGRIMACSRPAGFGEPGAFNANHCDHQRVRRGGAGEERGERERQPYHSHFPRPWCPNRLLSAPRESLLDGATTTTPPHHVSSPLHDSFPLQQQTLSAPNNREPTFENHLILHFGIPWRSRQLEEGEKGDEL